VVTAEYAAYKYEMCRKSGTEVYAKAYEIHLVEEIVFLIADNPECYESNDELVDILGEICKQKRFLSEFLKWALNDDYANISSLEHTYDTLRNFGEFWKEHGKYF
jgi:hypothetical protein